MTNQAQVTEDRPSGLRRDLRLIDAVGVGLGAVIGAGIFVVTGVAAGVAGPAFIVWIVGVGATTAMLGVLLSQIVGISRMMFAMARRSDLPRVLEHTSSKHGVPDYGILLSGFVIVMLSIFGTLQWVVAAAAFTILLYYGIANIAALRLANGDKLYPKWIAVLGLISCLALAASLPLATILTGLGLLIMGFVLRRLFQKYNSRGL